MSAFPKHPKAPYAHPTTLNAEYQFAAYPLITNLPDTDRILIEVPDGSRQWIDNASKYFTIEESDGTEATDDGDDIHYAVKDSTEAVVYRLIKTDGEKLLLETDDGGRFWIAADRMVRASKDIEEPLPYWAERRSDGKYMETGAQLPTQDGRRRGNAVVAFVGKSDHGDYRVATVITDAGNKMTLTEEEMEGMFYPPTLIMKREGISELVLRSEGRDGPSPEHTINIILDESDPTSPRFVEIEDDEGKSINIGQRSKYGEYTKIRITAEGIANA